MTTTTGSDMNGPAVTARKSPTSPLPPMPSTSTLVMASGSAIRAATPVSATVSTPAAICSGIDAVAAYMPSVSRGAADVMA